MSTDRKERPILFSGAMVRAILDGTKTQTRRMVKLPYDNPLGQWEPTVIGGQRGGRLPNGDTIPLQGAIWHTRTGYCLTFPYGQPGDRLMVASEIPGVGGDYCAGTNGFIYSRARGSWRPLKAHANGNGYLCVTVMLAGRKTTRAVHSLVCAAFYGPPPFDGAQVRHLDGNPQRNTPDNLCWGTQAENWQDRRAHGNGVEGEKHHAAKLTDDERAHLRWAIERGLCSQRHAARVMGMAQSSIGQVMLGVELRASKQPETGMRIPPILLEVVSVRVERLNDCSEHDALAEGIKQLNGRYTFNDGLHESRTAKESYLELWESINGSGSWDTNPWVWVVEFKRINVG